jgi:site-specific DNA-methyltransferase (adenine-specific)
MTVSLRLAGFEIRDVIEWLYFSGFPKSLDVSKAIDKKLGAERHDAIKGGHIGISQYGGDARNSNADMYYVKVPPVVGKGAMSKGTPVTDLAKKWDGWGTALKPAHEPIIMARKPLDGAVADNVERWGTGAINIDGCRLNTLPRKTGTKPTSDEPTGTGNTLVGSSKNRQAEYDMLNKGRFPANCATTEPDAFFSKYFNVTPPELCKKASKRDRNSDWRGELINLPDKPARIYGEYKGTPEHATNIHTKRANNHPTTKPTDLMAWLVRLVTPPGGIVLDPFAGSGSTCVAARREGFFFIGIEQELEYVEIARKRVGEIDTVPG